MLMVHSGMAAMTGAGFGVAPPGQHLFTANASFVVPGGVSAVSVVAIGRGANAGFDGEYSRSGRGGQLVWVNQILVSAGETLQVQVTNAHSRLLRGATELIRAYSGDTYAGSVVGRGGEGSSTVFELTRRGGGAGGYTSAGEDAGSINQSRGGGGSSPYGGGAGAGAGTEPTGTGGTYGGGGALQSPNMTYQGGPGCVRIIWGEGRAFPNTNTGDL